MFINVFATSVEMGAIEVLEKPALKARYTVCQEILIGDREGCMHRLVLHFEPGSTPFNVAVANYCEQQRAAREQAIAANFNRSESHEAAH